MSLLSQMKFYLASFQSEKELKFLDQIYLKLNRPLTASLKLFPRKIYFF